MATYELVADNAITGTKLKAEILSAHGVSVTPRFTPPRTVNIPEEHDAIDMSATVAAHVPDPDEPPPVWISKEVWLQRLTDDEYGAIWASKDVQVLRLRDRLLSTKGDLNLASDEMQNGVGYLATVDREGQAGVKLIADHRPAELLEAP